MLRPFVLPIPGASSCVLTLKCEHKLSQLILMVVSSECCTEKLYFVLRQMGSVIAMRECQRCGHATVE